MEYSTFLQSKSPTAPPVGIHAEVEQINPTLFPFQRDVVVWALRRGCAAIWGELGLGKTFMQVEWAKHIAAASAGRVLIVCPLAVAHQTIREAAKLGVPITFVRSQADVEAAPTALVITNYEMLIREVFEPSAFAGIVLDESSKLKTFTGTTKQYLIRAFSETPYRLACSATPSPNDLVELGNHAEFLGVMSAGDMLTRFFMRDSNNANEFRLKGLAVVDFWRWVTSWGIAFAKPSDINPDYDDTGYVLPELQISWEQVSVDHSRAWSQPDAHGQAELFINGAKSATAVWGEKRATLTDRAAKAAELVTAIPDGESVILWHDTDYERDAIKDAIPGVTTVTGGQSAELKEKLLIDFTEGRARLMSTKPRIGGWGLNWQHCHRAIYVGVTHKFEEWYQSLGRIHRFGQQESCKVAVIYAESEDGIVATLQRKWRQHNEMRGAMVAAMRAFGLARETERFDLSVAEDHAAGDTWEMHRGDSVRLIQQLADASIHLSISSWPFSDQYAYSEHIEDMGNCVGDDTFFEQMDYLIPELYRVTVPGRFALVHCKDRLVYGTKNDGYRCINDFSGDCVRAMKKHGWLYFGRITIATDPVRENAQTNNLGYLELQKDASRIGAGMPEYLLLFRKHHTKTDAGGQWSDIPIDSLRAEHGYTLPRWQIDANSFWRSSGDRHLMPWERDGYDYHAHVAYLTLLDERGELGRANGEQIPTDHPGVWWDIARTDVLNSRLSKENPDEKHICPLQLDLIERGIVRFSNPGETVLDYFMGIGSVGVVALQLGRRAVGMELKRSYFDWACRHLRETEFQRKQPTFFDLLEMETSAELELAS